MKHVLIISYNKVPLREDAVVEGTGLRAWRLAQGLATDPDLKIVVAVAQTEQAEGKSGALEVRRFEPTDEGIERLLSTKPDTIIGSYAMSGIMKKIIDHAPKTSQVIADAYSPFYIEFFSNNLKPSATSEIMKWYPVQLNECNAVLVLADYVVVANEYQQRLYTGAISAFGPAEAVGDRFITIPGAVEDQPRETVRAKIDPSRLEILWFGGMYPWFDFSSLIELFADPEVAKIAYLRVVGASNPMYKKTDQRYNGQYVRSHKAAKERGLIGRSIYFEDWVNYADRLRIFDSADCAVSVNSVGLENEYSWRIRVADLAGNDVPVLTNGGDPLSEQLISRNLAARLDFSDLNVAKSTIQRLAKEPTYLAKIRENLTKSHELTHIYSYAERLKSLIKEHDLPRLSRPQPLVFQEVDAAEQLKVQLKDAQLKIYEERWQKDYWQKEFERVPKTLRQFIRRRITSMLSR